jgi:hypothetical protein
MQLKVGSGATVFFSFVFHINTFFSLRDFEASRLLSHTPLSAGLLWTSDQPVAETYTWQHTTFTIDSHVPGGIRTLNPSKQAAADPRRRPRGHWDRQQYLIYKLNCV